MIEKEDTHQESSDWGFGSWGFHDVFFVCLCYDWYFLIWSSNIVVCFYKGKKICVLTYYIRKFANGYPGISEC